MSAQKFVKSTNGLFINYDLIKPNANAHIPMVVSAKEDGTINYLDNQTEPTRQKIKLTQGITQGNQAGSLWTYVEADRFGKGKEFELMNDGTNFIVNVVISNGIIPVDLAKAKVVDSLEVK